MATTNILELAKQFPNVSITVNASDLVACCRTLIADSRQAYAEQIRQEQDEEFLTREQVCKMFSVASTTVWRWTKAGYLPAVGIGGKVRYRRSDCKKLLEQRG